MRGGGGGGGGYRHATRDHIWARLSVYLLCFNHNAAQTISPGETNGCKHHPLNPKPPCWEEVELSVMMLQVERLG